MWATVSHVCCAGDISYKEAMYVSPQSRKRSHKTTQLTRSFHRGYSQDYGSGVSDRNRGDWQVLVTAKASQRG